VAGMIPRPPNEGPIEDTYHTNHGFGLISSAAVVGPGVSASYQVRSGIGSSLASITAGIAWGCSICLTPTLINAASPSFPPFSIWIVEDHSGLASSASHKPPAAAPRRLCHLPRTEQRSGACGCVV
jgi:hypothetical protein